MDPLPHIEIVVHRIEGRVFQQTRCPSPYPLPECQSFRSQHRCRGEGTVGSGLSSRSNDAPSPQPECRFLHNL
jgi:hypothetical protein